MGLRAMIVYMCQRLMGDILRFVLAKHTTEVYVIKFKKSSWFSNFLKKTQCVSFLATSAVSEEIIAHHKACIRKKYDVAIMIY